MYVLDVKDGEVFIEKKVHQIFATEIVAKGVDEEMTEAERKEVDALNLMVKVQTDTIRLLENKQSSRSS